MRPRSPQLTLALAAVRFLRRRRQQSETRRPRRRRRRGRKLLLAGAAAAVVLGARRIGRPPTGSGFDERVARGLQHG